MKVHDLFRPLHNITFFHWDADRKGVKTTWPGVQPAVSNVEIFAAHVANAIYASQEKTDISKIVPEPAAPISRASQLKELLGLKKVVPQVTMSSTPRRHG